MFRGPSVVPQTLRFRVLECLHTGHQGVKSMELRAQDYVWWPRMYQDIQDIQDGCKECIQGAQIQASAPPVVEYPFQHVCGDYMEVSR